MNLEQRRLKKKEEYRTTYISKGEFNTLGNYKLLWNDYHQGEALLTLGPNYIVFLFSFAAVNIASLIILHRLSIKEETHPFFLLQLVSIVFLDIVWLATALVNPGIAVPLAQEEGQFCEQCQSSSGVSVTRKPGRAHCHECDVCIDEQQHHLRIIGGCVGKHNFIVFKLFLLGFFLWGMSIITIVPILPNI